MAVVRLRSPLRDLAGGDGLLEVSGTTVTEVVAGLERDHPGLGGWIRDERGHVRRHVALFVNGERADPGDPVAPDDRVDILPSISGGSDPAELLVGTRKGLLVLRGDRAGHMDVVARRFSGQTVEFAVRDPRSGACLASVTHGQYGPRVYLSDHPTSEEWQQADGPAFPEDAGAAVERIWVIQPGAEDGVLWAGVAPAALFRSGDGGRTWDLVRGLWDRPERPTWNPGAGGLCLHSVCTWPGDPGRLAVGISAAGVWLTEDGGDTWRTGFEGLVPRYVPDESRATSRDLCVHNVHRSPDPERLYLQFHGGVYRSDDAGQSWIDIGSDGGLPSDFGFPLVADPSDAQRAYVIPLRGDFDRVTPDGRVRVYETGDAGQTWQPLSDGLPQTQAYLTVLRQAFAHDGRDPLGLYFGAESGEVFGSDDGGRTWAAVAEHLPPVLSVRVST